MSPNRLYLRLFNGFDKKSTRLPGWGSDGPLIGPFDWFHVTNMGSCLRLGVGDDVDLELSVASDGSVRCSGFQYDDWSVSTGEVFVEDGFDDSHVYNPKAIQAIMGETWTS